ncbi:hypothetical protein C8J56DRAFT_569679 [Mycena floridula]|nr:hypothetical protein C8J56DRAFT_569679 [Mycena floridula]
MNKMDLTVILLRPEPSSLPKSQSSAKTKRSASRINKTHDAQGWTPRRRNVPRSTSYVAKIKESKLKRAPAQANFYRHSSPLSFSAFQYHPDTSRSQGDVANASMAQFRQSPVNTSTATIESTISNKSHSTQFVARLRRRLNKLGHKPSIMDTILDAMEPFTDYTDDDLLEISERSQILSGLRSRHYSFDDPQSLHDYWADQAMIWTALEGFAENEPGLVRHQDSWERSTARGA